MKRLAVTVWAIVALSLAGCDLFFHGGGNRDRPYRLRSLDDVCFDALTGRNLTASQLLETIQPEYQAGLQMIEDDGTAGDAVLVLTIRAAYEDGPILCHPAFRPPPGSLAPEAPAFIEIELEVDFETSEGTFDESFAASFRGNGFSAGLDADALQGTFAPNPERLERAQVGFSGFLQGEETWGQVSLNGLLATGVSIFEPVALWDNR